MVSGPPPMRVSVPRRLGWDLDVGQEEEVRRGPGRCVEDLTGGRVLGRRAALSRRASLREPHRAKDSLRGREGHRKGDPPREEAHHWGSGATSPRVMGCIEAS